MLTALLLLACTREEPVDSGEVLGPPPLDPLVVEALSMERVRDHVDYLADPALNGRAPTSPGHLEAVAYIATQMADAGLEPVGTSFVVERPMSLGRDVYLVNAEGEIVEVGGDVTGTLVIGQMPGTNPDRADEYVVLMSHSDHLGVRVDGVPFPGAFDDAAGVASLLELARTLISEGVTFERPILFLITDGEEEGCAGSLAWVADPTIPLTDVVVALSVDPMGRRLLPDANPLALIGSERSAGVRAIVDEVVPHSEAPIGLLNRNPLVVFGSDQDNFWELDDPIPALWVASPGMTFYHTVEDKAETIDYRSIREHLAFIAQLVARFADDDETYADSGPQPISLQDARDVVALIDVLLASSELDDDERTQLAEYRADFQAAIVNDAVTPQLDTTYLTALAFVIGDLAPSHPGEIPPPFPE